METLQTAMGTWFSRFYDAALLPFELLGLRRARREIVGEAAGWVLEVGAGTGLNLPHYRRARQVVAMSPGADIVATRRDVATSVVTMLIDSALPVA